MSDGAALILIMVYYYGIYIGASALATSIELRVLKNLRFSKEINEKIKNHILIDNVDFFCAADYRKQREIIASEL